MKLKKIFLMLLTMLFLFSLVACNNEEGGNKEEIDSLLFINEALKDIEFPSVVESDIEIPTSINYCGYDIALAWESNNSALSIIGKVTRSNEDVNVTLTVTATLENEQVIKTYNLVVKGIEVEPSCEHDKLVLVNEVPATTEKTGIKAHYYCDICKKYFNEAKEEVSYEELIIPMIIDESKYYIRFDQAVLNAYMDKDYELTYQTNYDGEITWEVDDKSIVWLDEPFITACEVGTANVTVSFVADGETYSSTIQIIITIEKYIVYINNEQHYINAGSTYDDLLLELYGENEYPEKEGMEFVGWYFDSEYKDSCSTYRKIEDGITLYPKYKKYVYGIQIDKVLGYRSSDTFGGDVIAISPAYTYDVKNLDLTNYDLVVVKYDVAKEGYYVLEHGNKNVPFDGFLVCIKKDIEKHDEYMNKLTIGKEVYMDSYSINKASKLMFEHDIENVSTLSSAGLSCSFASAYDVSNKKSLLSVNGGDKAYPASTTKIITGMVACKYCPMDTLYTIGGEIDVMYQGSSPSTAGLIKGQTWTLRDLMYAMLLPSGNDAAYSVAACTINYLYPNNTWTSREQIDKFAELMNEMATTVGATGSHFTVPDGNSYYTSSGAWDDRLTYHYVTANDMVKFAKYAFAMGEMAEVVSTTGKTLTVDGKSYTFSNTNSLLSSNKYVVGMKTGTTTPAGACLVVGAYKDDRFVITVVLKSSDRYADTNLLLNQILK